MNTFFKYISLSLALFTIVGFVACTDDNDSENLYPDVTAGFDYTVNEQTKTITFLNTSTGGETYLWDLGNGTTSTEANPVVTYDEIGTYTVTLTTTNPEGLTATATQEVTINEYFYPLNFPIDFENDQSDFDFTDFGGAETARIDNPQSSGINTSGHVVEFVKPDGANSWAGTTIELENSMDAENYNTITMKVWSPKEGALVKLKIENADDGDIAYESDVYTTTSNEWEELSFVFDGIDTEQTYEKVSVFFDFENAGDGSTYYFDDLVLAYNEIVENPCTEETEANNLDPESAPLFIGFKDSENPLGVFGDMAEEVVDNPLVDDVNGSCTVYKFTKSAAGQTWGGTAVNGGLTTSIAPATQSGVLKMKVYSETRTANITLRLEFNPYPDTDPAVNIVVPTTQVGAWEELTFDFSEHTDKTFKSLVIYVDEGDAGDDSVYYFDDIMQE